ncbi:hypothetical protein [Bradyrhizobium sp. UNPA324]|uniref:hypothetical protein n=1 Tax=Bradyrhizobium sp. UNPA324 TaxID=1141174 RepID=UPI001153051E|nr:hypothetical protein [Bradyrhizobium sp. UNPA324]TQF29770.1 hypothetical protein UNPA324_09200 [Bradyrhizobium sp. UNPA324]
MANDNKPFSGALIEIDWDFEESVPPLRCPITGEIVAVGYDPETGEFAEGCEQPVWQKIPTVLFHYIPEVGEFDYIKPELQNEIDRTRTAMGEGAEDLDDFELLQDHVGSIGRAPLVFCLTTHGMACGPISTSIYVGLDLAAAR